jgi:hypothetical protein
MSIGAAALAILGCNIDGKYTVGGTLTGLLGQGLVLEDNSGNSLSLASNGAFVFSGGVDNGGAYSVTVSTQPSNPAQSTTVRAPSTKPMSPTSSSPALRPDVSPMSPIRAQTTCRLIRSTPPPAS